MSTLKNEFNKSLATGTLFGIRLRTPARSKKIVDSLNRMVAKIAGTSRILEQSKTMPIVDMERLRKEVQTKVEFKRENARNDRNNKDRDYER